jgi:Ni/Co efflux regulator RcnB
MRNKTSMFAIAILLLPTIAAADKGGKGHGRGHGQGNAAVESDRGRGDHALARGDVTVVFGAGEREAARGYFIEKHGRGGCPPGLAKKHNGCLPPGQAKKRYAIGRALPRGVRYAPPPPELRRRLGPPPRGYVYGIVDGDLLKLAAGTLLVVDAVQGLE